MTVATLLLAVALYITLRGKSEISESDVMRNREQIVADIYRERLAELEAERERGLLTEAVFDQLKVELQTSLLQDANASEEGGRDGTAATALPRPHLIMVVVIPLLSFLAYYAIGYQSSLTDWVEAKQAMGPNIKKMLVGEDVDPAWLSEQEIATFVRVLQSELQHSPEQLRGWVMLSRIFQEHKMVEPAYQAARKAYELAPDRFEIVRDYAQLILQQNNNKLTSQSEEVLNLYLLKQPHPALFAMKGMAAFNAEKYQVAIASWEQLLSLGKSMQLGNGELSAQELNKIKQGQVTIERSIAQAKQRLAQQKSSSGDKSATTTDAPLQEGDKGSSEVIAAKDPNQHPPLRESPLKASVEYHVRIELSEALASQWSEGVLPESAQLFVFIKAVSGPPMPLVAKRLAADEFPIQVVLSQADSMMPSIRLANYDDVMINGRLSMSGQAKASVGDWQGSLKMVQKTAGGSEDKPLVLVVNEVVK